VSVNDEGSRPVGHPLWDVFEEPDEHARQHPRDGDVGELLLAPSVEGLRRALALPGRRILRLERGVDLRVGVAAPAEVFLQF
jgi:hypothetical protein